MTNDQFKQYLAKRIAQVQAEIDAARKAGDLAAQRTAQDTLATLESFAKIARGRGSNLRRVRRDYERRLAKSGITLTL